MSKILATLTALFFFGGLTAQSVIAFRNASLEGEPGANSAPYDWYYCNFPGESPPDLHPLGLYRVRLPAADGQTYVGMVCRDNASFESIGQQLPTPLAAGRCYRWRGAVARTPRYLSIVRSTLRPDDFSAPVRLVFYGGTDACADEYLLGLSDSIRYTDWHTLEVILRVPAKSPHLRIGVQPYDTTAANGHVLLDRLQPLVPCHCETGRPLGEIVDLPVLRQPDWHAIVTELDRHLRYPQSGVSAFRRRGIIQQGVAVLAQVTEYLEFQDTELDIGILLADRQAFRTVRTLLENRLKELSLTADRLRFKKLSRPPAGEWVSSRGIGILYLRPR